MSRRHSLRPPTRRRSPIPERVSSLSGVDAIPADTHPDVHAMQIELLRRAGPERRAQMALTLTSSMIHLQRQALRRLDPDADDIEIGLRHVALQYSEELAAKMRARLGR